MFVSGVFFLFQEALNWTLAWFSLVVVIFPCTICFMHVGIVELKPRTHRHYKRIRKCVCERQENILLALSCPLCGLFGVVCAVRIQCEFAKYLSMLCALCSQLYYGPAERAH